MENTEILSQFTLIGYAMTRDVFLNGKKLDPAESLQIVNHSPDGFNWGYGGSGPSQLALAVLIKAIGAEQATHFYQKFKWAVISKLPDDFNVRVAVEVVPSNPIGYNFYFKEIK